MTTHDFTSVTDDIVSATIEGTPDYGSAPVLAGDSRDDDGQVIDDFFKAGYGSPAPDEDYALPTEPNVTQPTADIVPTTRVIVQTYSLSAIAAQSDPFFVMPEDKNRIALIIQMTPTATATDYVQWADERNKCVASDPINSPTNISQAMKVFAANPFNAAHTGAVWLSPVVASGVREVSVIGVTKNC